MHQFSSCLAMPKATVKCAHFFKGENFPKWPQGASPHLQMTHGPVSVDTLVARVGAPLDFSSFLDDENPFSSCYLPTSLGTR